MRIFEDFYVYPWMSTQENNANTIFIDGQVPTLIDPGHTHLFRYVVEGMARDGVSIDRVKLIICTHGHPDHLEAAEQFDKGVVRAIGKKECDYLEEEGKELFLLTGSRSPRKAFGLLLKEGLLDLGDKQFAVIETPGHSPGGLCLYWPEKALLVSGDTVFYMGVGRTDLPGGDMDLLGQSLRRLSSLDVEFLIPGHGDMVKGRQSISKNFEVLMSEFFA
ncbi:MAG TPA: MBL fold metallo-hydrolase [Deltaproteobacteria bacterium]|nr:MBL fold metallo-hydrolase [Deltaproteobacteria bacterium]